MTILPLSSVKLDTCLYSAGGFSNVPKLANYLIRLAKFSKSIPLEPFSMPLCFLFSFKFYETSRYSFELTAIATRQRLSIFYYRYFLSRNNLAFSYVFFSKPKNIPKFVGTVKSFIDFCGNYNLKNNISIFLFRQIAVWISDKNKLKNSAICVS